jgi:hypothetical protein
MDRQSDVADQAALAQFAANIQDARVNGAAPHAEQ